MFLEQNSGEDMSPFWRDKTYKALLGLNSIVSYFLRALMLGVLMVFCLPAFVIIGVCIFVGIIVTDHQEAMKEKLEVWAYGENKNIHE